MSEEKNKSTSTYLLPDTIYLVEKYMRPEMNRREKKTVSKAACFHRAVIDWLDRNNIIT